MYPLLIHAVSVSNGNCLVFEGLKINSNAQRRSNLIVAPIAFANISRIFQQDSSKAKACLLYTSDAADE